MNSVLLPKRPRQCPNKKESLRHFHGQGREDKRHHEVPRSHNRYADVVQRPPYEPRTKGIKSGSSARRHHAKHRRAEAAATVASFIVVHFVILYGAPIWADALCNNPSYGAACQRACRTIALRVACAYRTVSDIALSVVAGLTPV